MITIWIIFAIMTAIAIGSVLHPLYSGFKKEGLRSKQTTPVILIALAIPLLALTLYHHLGSYQALKFAQARALILTQIKTPQDAINRLNQYLKMHPDQAEGWLILSKLYHHVDDEMNAKRAYAQYQSRQKH